MDLADLHARVPAAQEEDLLEEVVRERRFAESVGRLAEAGLTDDEVTGDPQPDRALAPNPEQDPPLRPGQVLGLLEHLLGAQVITVHRSLP